jgi:hypothetical protein
VGGEGTEAVLTLGAVISSGDFEECWHYRLAREHQRLCPGTAQGQYALGGLIHQSFETSRTRSKTRTGAVPCGSFRAGAAALASDRW